MLDLDAARTAVRREMVELVHELGVVADDAWSRPTRCAGWTVADLVAHLVWGQRLEAQAVEAVGTGRTTPLGVPAVGVAAPRELLAQLGEAHARLWEALADRTTDDLGASAPMPYGSIPLGLLLQVIAMEVGVHHSDVRAALGLAAHLAPDVVTATATFLAAFLPVLAAPGCTPSGPLSYRFLGGLVDLWLSFDATGWSTTGAGATATVTFSGADSDLCLLALGRVRPDSPRIEVVGDAAVAGRFPEYVPGP